MNVRADRSATAQVIPLPLARRKLGEASIVPIARAVSAIVFDAPPNGARARPRLTALFDGQALRGPTISTSLELRSGGGRHVLVVGRSAESLTGMTVTLALGAQLAAILDGDWLQPPIADRAALVRGLTEPGRRRLLKLFMTTGASLFGRGSPEFAEAARRLAEAAAAVAAAPASWCRLGAAGRIVSYRMPAGIEAPEIEELIAVGPEKVMRVADWRLAVEPSGPGSILHLFLPGAMRGCPALVGLGKAQVHLRALDAELAPRALVPWLARRSAAIRAWVEGLVEPAARSDPAAAALMRELRQTAEAGPKAVVRHLSATRGGVLFAVELADPHDLVRALRIERGEAVAEVAPGVPCGFAELPRPAEGADICRVALVHHSGRITTVHRGAAEAFSGEVPDGVAAGSASALAAARLDLERVAPVGTEAFGAPVAKPPLTVVAAVGENLDVIRARAALLFCEPRGQAVELVYHARSGPLAEAARAAIAQAQAVYGIAHWLVTVPATAMEADSFLAALAAASAPRLLSLGADVLPAAPGWLAPWLARPDDVRPVLGGMLLDVDGSVVHAGGTVAGALPEARQRAVGWPARDVARGATATDLVSPDCVGLASAVAELLCTATPHYPNPDVMLASAVQAVRRQGREARTLPQCRFVRYSARMPRNGIVEAVDASALGMVLKPFFRPAGDEGQP